MKTFNKMICAALLGAASLTGAYASGTSESTVVVTTWNHTPDQLTVGSVEVPVTADIRAWFTANGVDGTKIDAPLASLSVDFKDSIDDLVNDVNYRQALTPLVDKALKAALVRGSVEHATLHLGRNVFTADLLGTEDKASS